MQKKAEEEKKNGTVLGKPKSNKRTCCRTIYSLAQTIYQCEHWLRYYFKRVNIGFGAAKNLQKLYRNGTHLIAKVR